MSRKTKRRQPKLVASSLESSEHHEIHRDEGRLGADSDSDQGTIAAFFSDPAMTPSAFFEVLKRRQIDRFKDEDEERTLELMETTDPDGERFWALVSQSSLPKAVDSWIWRAAQRRLRSIVDSEVDLAEPDAGKAWKALIAALAPSLRSKEKQVRTRAMNWLRIGVCWLVEKRSLQLWAVADSLVAVLFDGPSGAVPAARHALLRGPWKKFELAVAIAGVAQEKIRTAEAQLQAERAAVGRLEEEIRKERSESEKLRSEVASLESRLRVEAQAKQGAEARLQVERQHWEHMRSELMAKNRVFLGERIGPLVSDAIDALEIEPSRPDIALGRLKRVLSLIEEKES